MSPKKKARDAVERARTGLSAAEASLAAAVENATVRAGQPANNGHAVVDPAAATGLATAQERLGQAQGSGHGVIFRVGSGVVFDLVAQDEVGAEVSGLGGGEVLAQLRDGGGGATGG